MTIKEAAALVGVDPMTIRRWIRTGKLRAEKGNPGGVPTWEIERAELDAYLASRAPDSVSVAGGQGGGGDSVLRERIHGLENVVKALEGQVQTLQGALERRDAETAVLIATTARLTEARALPTRPGLWARLFGQRERTC